MFSTLKFNSKLYIFLMIGFILSCSHKAEKDHLKHTTLKLAKPLSIQLSKLDSETKVLNLNANVKYKDPIQTANIQWVILDSVEQKILQRVDSFAGNDRELNFQISGFELPNSDENYKVIFIFSGQTKTEEISNNEIFNTLIQEDLESAIKNLQQRAKSN